jgi:pilus assembly protein CpaD
VEPSFQSLKLSFSSSAQGLMPDDEARFMDFVQTYIAHGNGAISVSVPDGPGSNSTIHYFGDRLADMGIVPSRILVGTRSDGGNDGRVELGYVTYVAHADSCGDWSDSVSNTSSNLTTKNFGCSTQHNIAAMVADPRDLQAPKPLGPIDATRRAGMMDKYEKGEPTETQKHMVNQPDEQAAPGSDVGRQ